MTLLSLVLMNIGCEEQIDTTKVSSNEGEMVEVSLNIGFADEADGYTVATKAEASSGKGAFSYELQPSVITKGDAVKPDKLYNLEIQQYDQSGNHIGGMNASDVTDHEIGSILNLSLAANTDCQLVIVAWGEGNTTPRLGTDNTLADVQKLSIDASVINSIPTDNMNKMPYVLHLEHVDATISTIRSREGEDVRLLLKRLAARLTLNWSYSYTGYTLKQILLESIPTNYNVVPNPDKTDNTYPSLLDQFTTIQIDPASESGKSPYSCWIPANVRGTNLSATSQNFRIKANAPTGSSYASFIAVNDKDPKKKLNYRVYLGGSTSSDFNIRSNTNYNYTVKFNHTGLPVNDYRVTIIDPIPASLNNDYLVPTANCFMVAPGGAFCFDPFKYQIAGNNDNTNTTLQEWAKSGGIAYVKLLWQTKENGDVGDPVMGVVTSADDHTNIVDIKRIDKKDISSNLVTDKDQAYIYCRVAPNTTGGSGAIAAYNTSGEILWSWHVWVTDYNPDARGNKDVQIPVNKRKLKFEYGSYTNNLPMMDRNLGAAAGYVNQPPNALEKSKTNGFYYQWGRKDPFRGSYSNTDITSVLNGDIKKNAPTKGLLSMFKADGITFYPMSVINQKVSYRDAYKDPGNMYKISSNSSGNYQWITSQTTEYKNAWGAGSGKGLHDPCPAGWLIAKKANYYQLFNSGGTGGLRVKEFASGGYVIYYDKNGTNTTYIYLAGYWSQNGLTGITGNMYMWCGDALSSTNGRGGSHLLIGAGSSGQFLSSGNERESLLVRCIQEQE